MFLPKFAIVFKVFSFFCSFLCRTPSFLGGLRIFPRFWHSSMVFSSTHQFPSFCTSFSWVSYMFPSFFHSFPWKFHHPPSRLHTMFLGFSICCLPFRFSSDTHSFLRFIHLSVHNDTFIFQYTLPLHLFRWFFSLRFGHCSFWCASYLWFHVCIFLSVYVFVARQRPQKHKQTTIEQTINSSKPKPKNTTSQGLAEPCCHAAMAGWYIWQPNFSDVKLLKPKRKRKIIRILATEMSSKHPCLSTICPSSPPSTAHQDTTWACTIFRTIQLKIKGSGECLATVSSSNNAKLIGWRC